MQLRILHIALPFVVALLTACSSTNAADLTGTQWWLEAMTDAPDEAAAQVPTVVFETGRANGRAGCNTWMAAYQTSGATLTFGSIGVTKKMCPYGMEYERAFLAALTRTARANVSGERLTLLDANGAELLRFHRASLAPPPQ